MSSQKSSLLKPYLASEFNGTLLLPDFIYRDDKNHFIIEIMGLTEHEDYKEGNLDYYR